MMSDQADASPDQAAPGARDTGPTENGPTENGDRRERVPLPSLLESLLFVAEEPVEPTRLARAVQRDFGEVTAALDTLRAGYERENRGLRLLERNGRVQLVTNPTAAQVIEDFLNLDMTTRLSGPALETLAIVAYRQPVTRAQVEAVRGVDCSGVLRKLQQLELVEETGRLEVVGRPILYAVTDRFLHCFGLTSMDDLPDLPQEEKDQLGVALEMAEDLPDLNESDRFRRWNDGWMNPGRNGR